MSINNERYFFVTEKERIEFEIENSRYIIETEQKRLRGLEKQLSIINVNEIEILIKNL